MKIVNNLHYACCDVHLVIGKKHQSFKLILTCAIKTASTYCTVLLYVHNSQVKKRWDCIQIRMVV